MENKKIGVIGGSGLYEMEGLEDIREEEIVTPFGEPSDKLITGWLDGRQLVFLPRHGRGHYLLPSELNFRANIWAMKKLGVEVIISVSAVGSMKEHIEPGHIVIPDQFIDYTKNRVSTFFGNGIVAHVSFADPICTELSKILFKAGKDVGATVHNGGTYVCIEGPQFSTRAESNVYRKLGVDVIGMTNVTEAKLAREAEICYGTIALSTDYDCWHESEDDVSADAIIKIINQNVSMAKKIIKKAVNTLGEINECGCGTALKHSFITAVEKIPQKTKKDLEVIIGKYISCD